MIMLLVYYKKKLAVFLKNKQNFVLNQERQPLKITFQISFFPISWLCYHSNGCQQYIKIYSHVYGKNIDRNVKFDSN